MEKITVLALLAALPWIVVAQDSLLVEAMQKNARTFKLTTEGLAGDGLDFFLAEGQKARFFLIGEDHGMAENPQFTAALFRHFKTIGYRYFATETGPYTAEMVQKMAGSPDWKARFEAHFRQYPWSIPFYNWQEECEIPRAVLEGADGSRALLWGLDQEFAASFRMFFKKLETEAATPESKAVAGEYYRLAEKAYAESFGARDPSKSFLAIVKPDDFDRLRKTFEGRQAALDLIRELDESVQIYQLWYRSEGYASNRQRAEMMKRHFTAYYSAAKEKGEDPRVMFKLGANHVYRGLNALNVPDIGNFISELAAQSGQTSFHLYTLGRKGTQNGFTPFSRSDDDKHQPYDAGQYLDKVDFSTVLKATPETAWSVIDLRPLRKALFNKTIKNVDPGLERIIYSYDAILVFPQVHASRFFLD
ncbi:MAG TPA: hypothetical protein PKE06_12045 [Flavilitoribacter sp.]|nr:hypothetical protein [Flavilitoribacter sp.]HMQ88142.1 hypothetical protein [Flavilitoribacter sp.]